MVRKFHKRLDLPKGILMQTFLPYPDFVETAKCLDRKRLWKQCLEAFQLLNIVEYHKASSWKNHPACKMWMGYGPALRLYLNSCLLQWVTTGGNNNTIPYHDPGKVTNPPWLGHEYFHKTHRIALLTKKFEHYSQFGWEEKPNPEYKYWWPV